jgi:hypothetical protein
MKLALLTIPMQGQTENWDALLSMVTLEQKRNLYASIGYTTDEEESTVIIPKDVCPLLPSLFLYCCHQQGQS